MPYTANGAWEQLIEGNRKVDFSLAIVRTSNTNIPQDKIESVSLESTATSNNSINFGTTCSDSVKITLRDYDSTLLFEGAKLKLTASVANDDNTSTADYQVGMFYVDSVKKTETYGDGLNLEITAYDGFYKTEQIYSPSASLGANPTIRAVVTDILQKCGLTDRFGDAFIDETEWSNTITLDSIKADLTCRQQIGYLAALQGCFAKFNDEGNLTAKWYTDTAKVITRDEQFMAEMTQDMKSDLTVAMIETGTSDNVIVKPSSALGYSIKFENPYITDSIADSIYTNKVSGGKIKFRPLTVRWRGNPQILVGDIVKVEDKTGNYLTCYVMQKTLSFDGGMSETYKCYGESTSSVAFNKSPSDVKFERIYSRMEEAVKAATSAVKQTEGSTFELIPKTKDSTENIGFRLYYKDSQDSAFDKCVIMATAGGIGFSTNGGESYDAAAIYFAKDSSGVIHGYINGEFIQAGTISSDKINTSQLIISKGNVEGLESDLTTINNNVTTANSNASAAVSTANEAKGTADSVSGTISDWIYTDHGVTYIDGGKIYTGSIAANSIDVSKLSAGKGELVNLFYNADFSKSTISAWGWQGYNTLLTREANYVSAKYLKIGANLIDHDTSEFITTNKWKKNNATFSKPNPNLDYIQFVPSSSSSSYIYTSVRLENGKKYSVSAQINAYAWAKIAANKKPCIGVVIDDGFYFTAYGDASNFTPATGEQNIEFVFTYTGATRDNIDVGFAFRGMLTSDDSPTGINIAWIACCEVENTREYGFYTSNVNWLANDYKTSHLVNGGTLINSADKYLAHISTTQQPELQIVLQKRMLEKGKRYVMLARLKFLNLTTVNSNAALGWWHGSGYWYDKTTLIANTSTSNYFTAKFVFDYGDETGIRDVGIHWKGILDDAGQPCEVRLHWFQLYQDDTAPLGFFASDASWLKSAYKESHLITNSDTPSDYNKKPGLMVSNNSLYFYGNVVGNVGNIGCLQYAPTQLSVNGATYYFEDAANPSTSTQESISSSLKIRQPDSIIDFNLDSYEKVNVSAYTSAHMTLRSESSYDNWDETDYTPAGVRCTNHKGNCVTLTADGIGLKKDGGLTLTWKQLYHLAQNTPET